MICIDLRKNQTCPKAAYVKGEAVESVEAYILRCGFGKYTWLERELQLCAENHELKDVLLEKTEILLSKVRCVSNFL